MSIRYFRYVGEATATRGEYGEEVRAGRSEDGERITVFDATFGEMDFGAVGSPDFEEISEEEYRSL